MASKSTRGARPPSTTPTKTAKKKATKGARSAARDTPEAAHTTKPKPTPTARAKASERGATRRKPAGTRAASPGTTAPKRTTKAKAASTSARARSRPERAAAPARRTRRRTARAPERQPGVPPGYGPVTPHLIVSPCVDAMAFYAKAFGAERMSVLPGPGGLIVHAALRINGQAIMLADEQPPMPGRPEARKTPRSAGATTGGVMLYVADVDAWHDRAVEAGATSRMAPSDMFWGDRYAQLEDPFGHVWAIATYQRAVSEAEMIAAMVIMSEGAAGGAAEA